jgi:hypothetical protein
MHVRFRMILAQYLNSKYLRGGADRVSIRPETGGPTDELIDCARDPGRITQDQGAVRRLDDRRASHHGSLPLKPHQLTPVKFVNGEYVRDEAAIREMRKPGEKVGARQIMNLSGDISSYYSGVDDNGEPALFQTIESDDQFEPTPGSDDRRGELLGTRRMSPAGALCHVQLRKSMHCVNLR